MGVAYPRFGQRTGGGVRRTFDITDFDPETQKEIQKKFGDDGAEPGKQ